jgi:hypothetical protein
VTWLGSFVARGRNLFVAGDNRIFGFTTATNLGFPEESSLGYPGTLTGFSTTVGDLALEGMGTLTNVIGVGLTGPTYRLFRMTYPTSPFITTPTALVGMATPLVARGTVWYVAAETTNIYKVCRATIGGTPTCSSDNTEDLYPLPILTDGDRLLTTASRSGLSRIQERDRVSLTVIWEGRAPRYLAGVVCGEFRETGIAYAHDDFELHSVVIDAKGLDATADWPMATHDPQGTRNHSLPLSRFQCP